MLLKVNFSSSSEKATFCIFHFKVRIKPISVEQLYFQQEQFDLLQAPPVESSVFYRQFKKAPIKLELSPFSPKIIEIQNEAKYVISEKVLPGSVQFI